MTSIVRRSEVVERLFAIRIFWRSSSRSGSGIEWASMESTRMSTAEEEDARTLPRWTVVSPSVGAEVVEEELARGVDGMGVARRAPAAKVARGLGAGVPCEGALVEDSVGFGTEVEVSSCSTSIASPPVVAISLPFSFFSV